MAVTRSEAARILGQHPVIGTAQCEYCGATIERHAGVPHLRRFCNRRCRAAARYRAQKERLLQLQRERRARKRQQAPAVPERPAGPPPPTAEARP
jgi:hypothetical protein